MKTQKDFEMKKYILELYSKCVVQVEVEARSTEVRTSL